MPSSPRRQRKPAASVPPPAPAAETPPTAMPTLPPEEHAVLGLLSTAAKHVDLVIEESGLTPAQVNAALLMLELKGFIQRRPGNVYIRLR